MKKGLIVFLVFILIIVLLSVIFFVRDSRIISQIESFEECAVQGFPVMESYPRQCRTSDGRTFTEELNEINHPMIKVTSPSSNQIITSPVAVSGEARGNWFFEASFPIALLDANGNEIPIEPGFIMTSLEWMTTDFVPFEAEISFGRVQTETGTLVLKRDNPSGLPENDDEIRIPVRFLMTENEEPEPISECMPTGCSGQICSDEEVFTTCEYKSEYECYPLAVCERQPSGECGWTETSEFQECLAQI